MAVIFGVTSLGAVVVHQLDVASWNRARIRYQDYLQRYGRWQADSESARTSWIEERVLRAHAVADANVAPLRRSALEHNAAVRARNALLPKPRVSVEPLPNH